MKHFSAAIILGFGVGFGALAQTNTSLEYWVRPLNFQLTATTNASVQTNGIIATQQAVQVRISSRDITHALSGLTAYTLGKALTNYSIVITNHQPGPDLIVTNLVEVAYPVYTGVVPPPYSERAKLLYFEPVGTNSLARPMVVIRDGASEYVVTQYFVQQAVSFDMRSAPVVTQGRFDVAHDLVSTTESSVQQFEVDTAVAGGNLVFDVQGFTTEKQFSLIKRGIVIDRQVTESLSAEVAGTGQIGGTNGFCVVRGTVRSADGRYEVR